MPGIARLAGLGARLQAMSRFRRSAAAASVAWLVLVLTYGIGFLSVASRETRFLDAMLFILALALPVLLVWLAAWLAEELERQREIVAALAEVTAPLIATLGATRAALEGRTPATSPEAIRRVVESALVAGRPDHSVPLERLLAGQARIEVSLQKLTLRRAAAEPQPDPDSEPAAEAGPAPPPPAPPPASPPVEPAEPPLPLIPVEETPARPDWADLVRALDFPRDADDKAGFRALKAALRHHGLAQMLQAAEDVLDLLSQEGVFVDELPMAPVDAGAWRRFIAGRRGPEVSGLGGIGDARALEAARSLMRADSIFRDSALFFQRRFDGVLGEFAARASDAELEELARTRSGRAFMMLARLSGSLD